MAGLIEVSYYVCIKLANHRNFSIHMLKGCNILANTTVAPVRLWNRKGEREHVRISGTFSKLFGKFSGFVSTYAFRRACPCV